MNWDGKPYYALDYYYKQQFGIKMAKLSIDAGFSCPNREGTASGCTFCSSRGSGDFTSGSSLSITHQIQQQKQIMSSKWHNCGYIAYFQAFTNTYAPVSILKEKYEEALLCKEIAGLSIATRPDCLPPDVLALLHSFSQKTFLTVELGFQTSNELTAQSICRGYSNAVFLQAVENLHQLKIPIVVHVILGLPYETKEDILSTISFLSHLPIQGIKLHLLHVLQNTPLGESYKNAPFPLFTKEEYVDIVCSCITALPPHIVIHRLTGDAPRHSLIAPLWSLKKREVLNSIHHHMKKNFLYQGKNFEK